MSNKDDVDFWRTRKKKDGTLEWDSFSQYDFEAAEKKLKPEARAHDFAVSGVDVSDDSKLTTGEIEMIADVNSHIVQLREWFSRGVGAIQDKITSATADVDIEGNFRKIREKFNSNSRVIIDDYRRDRQKLYRDGDQALRELRSFRITNKLQNRPATYPESVLYHLALVLVAIVGESIANSYFFGQASDVGLLGGFTTAFLMSFANVAFSMLAGFLFLRQVNHVSITRKVIGVVSFSVSMVVIGFLHLAIAHYRELLTRSPDADIIAALGPALENPFGLQDMESMLLICIGIVISAIGVWKGYTLDDPYPGYGSVYRRWKDLDDQMIEIERDVKHQVGGEYDKATASVHNVLSKMKLAKKDLELLKGDIGAYLSCYEAYYSTAKNSAIRFVSTFRNIVQSVYNSQDKFPCHDSLLDGEGGLESLDPNADRERVKVLLSSNIARVDSMIDAFPQKQEEFLDELSQNYAKQISPENIRKKVDDLPDLDKAED